MSAQTAAAMLDKLLPDVETLAEQVAQNNLDHVVDSMPIMLAALHRIRWELQQEEA